MYTYLYAKYLNVSFMWIMVLAGDSTQLDLDGLLYIGGVGAPFAPLTVPPVLWTGALRQGYVGCMRDLVINGHQVDIAGYAQQQDSGEQITSRSIIRVYINYPKVHILHPLFNF